MKNAEHIISTRATLNKCRRSSSVRANLHPSCALPPSLFTPLLTFISPFLFSFLIFPPFLSFNSLFPQVFISFKYFPIPVILFGRLSGHPFLSLCRLESLPQGLLTWDLWMPFRDLKNTDTGHNMWWGEGSIVLHLVSEDFTLSPRLRTTDQWGVTTLPPRWLVASLHQLPHWYEEASLDLERPHHSAL